MTDNKLDISIFTKGNRYIVCITYLHTNRRRDEERRIVSETTYRWETDCRELVQFLQNRRTKIFCSQLRALCRYYGTKTYKKY